MHMAEIKASLIDDLAVTGIKVAVVSVDCLLDIKEDLERVAASGEINLNSNRNIPQYQYRYDKIIRGCKYDYCVDNTLKGAKSILIFAVPIPVHHVEFTLDKHVVDVRIPSDYMQREAFKKLEYHLRRTLKEHGYSVKKAKLPLKLLAVRSGLAEYGRNNLVYVEGFGSRLCLVAFYTDCSLPTDIWREPVRMTLCNSCKNCLKNCPTQAIIENRKTIKAERCIVLYNELQDELPEWIPKDAHNSLIGCIRCEEKCPVNLKYKSHDIALEAFDEKQTKEILQTRILQDLSSEVYEKIVAYEINEYYPVFHRNFALLLKDESENLNEVLKSNKST